MGSKCPFWWPWMTFWARRRVEGLFCRRAVLNAKCVFPIVRFMPSAENGQIYHGLLAESGPESQNSKRLYRAGCIFPALYRLPPNVYDFFSPGMTIFDALMALPSAAISPVSFIVGPAGVSSSFDVLNFLDLALAYKDVVTAALDASKVALSRNVSLDPLPPQQPDFHDLRKAQVGKHSDHQNRPIEPWQSCEPEG